MTYVLIQLIVHLLLAWSASAVDKRPQTIIVYAKDTKFEPATITASPGDILEFHFKAHNHSVAMGNFSNACIPASNGGFFSGFLPVTDSEQNENDQIFTVVINNTDPTPFYCTKDTHCVDGMVGVVNPNVTMNLTLEAYKAAAKAQASRLGNDSSSTSSADHVFGGQLAPNPDSGSSEAGHHNYPPDLSAGSVRNVDRDLVEKFGVALFAGWLVGVFGLLV